MKDILIFEGKKYISARRGSEISDYNSDYIGQLCRAGKLDCRRVGRSWFITEESLNEHKEKVTDPEQLRSRINNIYHNSPPFEVFQGGSVALSPPDLISPNIFTPSVDVPQYRPSPVLEDGRHVRSKITLVPIIALMLVASWFIYNATSINDDGLISGQTAGVIDAIVAAKNFISNGYIALVKRCGLGRDLAVADKSAGAGFGTNSELASSSLNGMAIAPSQNLTEDEKTKMRIEQSFSDQVEVAPDKSGTAGVITPVFKDAKGAGFVYVLVPVKDKSKENNSNLSP